MSASSLSIDFAGEIFIVPAGQTFTVGRVGTLALEDNPYLHRNFLEISTRDDFWWLCNVGSHIPVSLTDEHGLMRSSVASGARLPIVFERSSITFCAGPTTYELVVVTDSVGYRMPAHRPPTFGHTTIVPTTFTTAQLQAILALAEPVLAHAGSGAWEIPSAVEAAGRLGWAQTRFNRKLDNVCDKLDRAGVGGLRGGPGASAGNRRMRLVEYAVSTLLVTAMDLPLLDLPAEAQGARL